MIAEQVNTASLVTRQLSRSGSKVPFMPDTLVGEALRCIERHGIPDAKHEEYKYCNLSGILRKEFRPSDSPSSDVKVEASVLLNSALNIIVANGHYRADLSDSNTPDGVEITALSESANGSGIGTLADPAQDAFIALNTAYSGNGVHIRIAKNASPGKPIHIIYINASASQSAVAPRCLVEMAENSSAVIIESQISQGPGKVFSAYVSEKILSPHSSLQTVLVQNEGQGDISVNTTIARAAEGSVYENTTITLSGHVVRNNHTVLLDGVHAVAHLNGLFSTRADQLVDNHTLMDHRVPDCESNELYKGLASGKSTGVFNGKIFVRKDAQKTNAYQSSKNILLSEDATINTKPQLEIYANDVKCSHGTSTGKVDEAALFYLNARGIGKETARKMLLASFAGEVVSRVPEETLRGRLEAAFAETLN
jgi:Fe-S cluster assembly protein SufD